MDRIMALAAFTLSLFGCQPQRSVFEHRTVDNGRELLHARASLESGVARLECLASATGRCVWTIAPPACAGAVGDCMQPPRRIAVVVDESRQLAGIADARLCVATDVAMERPGCQSFGVERAP